MVNNTVNGKKIGNAAGKDDSSLVTGIDVIEVKRKVEKTAENAFAELENDWDLEAKGKIHRKIIQKLQNKDDYLVFKVKDHVAYVENGQVIKREVVEKEAKKSTQREDSEK